LNKLGIRMKIYENVTRNYLTRRVPVLIRIDGKSFHSFTKGFQRPFDELLISTMQQTAKYLCENIQGCKLAYTQSDEITLLLTDYETIGTQGWFDYNIQKIVSVSASMATLAFNKYFFSNIMDAWEEEIISLLEREHYQKRFNTALFDSRVFNIPKEEVCNCFVWRQQDCTRNAIEMVGRNYFSHKELHKVNCNQIQEKLFQEKGINFNDLPTYQKRGACVIKSYYNKDGTKRSRWIVDKDIPIFTQDRDYIEKYI